MFHRKHPRILAKTGTVSLTKQSHKAECDINLILKQYQKTGLITHITKQQPLYSDLPDHQDYQQSLTLLREAQDAFASLPAKVRDHFSNDPAQFLAAFNDPRETDYLREMGVLRPLPAAPAADKVQEAPAAPPAPS